METSLIDEIWLLAEARAGGTKTSQTIFLGLINRPDEKASASRPMVVQDTDACQGTKVLHSHKNSRCGKVALGIASGEDATGERQVQSHIPAPPSKTFTI
jgi:hypothetical protein